MVRSDIRGYEVWKERMNLGILEALTVFSSHFEGKIYTQFFYIVTLFQIKFPIDVDFPIKDQE